MIRVDLPAPIFPSTETRKGLSVGVLTFVNLLSGDRPTKVVFFAGDPSTLAAGRLKPLIVVMTPSIIFDDVNL